MPYMPPTRCTTPQCGKLATHHGHCPQHQPPPWQTPSPHTKNLNRNQEKKWRNTVRTNANNTCQHCGQYTPHGQADHITPIADGGAYYDPNNGQWLCTKCHQQKTKKENKQRQQQHKHKNNQPH
ncbi:HNH endonuclease [Scardovia wiggsiae]|uniref:HNH endonuclease n=2 Tax=Scardovia wiggsiae TaxID=230143 RepID=UPI003D9FF56C